MWAAGLPGRSGLGDSVSASPAEKHGRQTVQTTVYYNEDDAYLIKRLDAMGRRERKSRSAALLSVLETYFESNRRLGEILVDLDALTRENLDKALSLQSKTPDAPPLGEILLSHGFVQVGAVERALIIQEGRYGFASK
jgi:hypothetical protein